VGWRLPDRDVSRRHARFTRANGSIFVEDLGSLTGTRLNGERIDSRRRVRPGDLVEIGAFDLVVLPEDMAESGPGTPPPLPAITRPDPMPAYEPEAPRPAEVAAVPAATPRPLLEGTPAPARRSRLVRIGALALSGGLLLGFLLGRALR
jgi:predicted component of type VI protein secretion system